MFDTWAKTIGEALLNSLWQGAALTLLAWLMLKLNRRASASARYVVCFATLAAVLALPVLHVVRPASQDTAQTAAVAPLPTPLVEPYTPMPAVSVERTALPTIRLPLEVPAGAVINLLVMLWIVLASLYCLRLARSYRALQRIKSEARPAPAPYDGWWSRWLLFAPSVREPQLRSSNRIRLPLTAGLTEPAIVFPANLLDKLDEQEARTIWLHELAHVRRLDDWTKLGQKLVEALLFFHPAVHWLGRKLEIEREIACDDWVVRQTGAPRPYAACLAKLAEYATLRPSSSPAPAMAADKKQIFRRVKMIINKNEKTRKSESRASGILIAVFLLAIAGAMMAAEPVFVLADAQTEEARPTPPAPPAPPQPPAPAVAKVAPPAPPALPARADARPVLPPVPPVPPAAPQKPVAEPKPEPRPAPKPTAAPKPAPAPKPRTEMDAELREEMEVLRRLMDVQREQMRALSQELREEVRANIEPHREEMRRLGREIRETVEKEMRPQIAELREMARDLEKERMANLPDEARLAEIGEKMAEVEKQIQATTEEHMRGLEDQMKELQEQMEPSEEVMKKFEEQMRELELEMQEKAQQMRAVERENQEKHREEQKQQSGPAQI